MESRSADSLPITKCRGERELAELWDESAERADVRKARRDWRGRGITDGVCVGRRAAAGSVMSRQSTPTL